MYVCFNSFLRYVLSRRSKTFVLFPLDAPPTSPPDISLPPGYQPPLFISPPKTAYEVM